MKVIVAGIDHSHQLSVVGHENIDPQAAQVERDQKEHFKMWLRDIVSEWHVQFIGEEIDSDTSIKKREADRRWAYELSKSIGLNPIEPTEPIEVIGRQVATERGCEYEEEEVDLCLAERRCRNIPIDYTDENSNYSLEQKAGWHREREDHMFRKTIEKKAGADVILIICGYEHAENLAKLFENAGNATKTLYLSQENWFIDHHDWSEWGEAWLSKKSS